jgi:hypothetical protein
MLEMKMKEINRSKSLKLFTSNCVTFQNFYFLDIASDCCSDEKCKLECLSCLD